MKPTGGQEVLPLESVIATVPNVCRRFWIILDPNTGAEGEHNNLMNSTLLWSGWLHSVQVEVGRLSRASPAPPFQGMARLQLRDFFPQVSYSSPLRSRDGAATIFFLLAPVALWWMAQPGTRSVGRPGWLSRVLRSGERTVDDLLAHWFPGVWSSCWQASLASEPSSEHTAWGAIAARRGPVGRQPGASLA